MKSPMTELRFIPNAFKHGVTEDEKKRTFENDEELIEFMEAHDGFELADQGFAEIIEAPLFSRKDKRQIIKNAAQTGAEMSESPGIRRHPATGAAKDDAIVSINRKGEKHG